MPPEEAERGRRRGTLRGDRQCPAAERRDRTVSLINAAENYNTVSQREWKNLELKSISTRGKVEKRMNLGNVNRQKTAFAKERGRTEILEAEIDFSSRHTKP